jgi:adenylosuccinate lyase
VSNQVVQRDRHANLVTVLAGLAATMEKIAINLRTLQRTEIGEIQEPFGAGQKGSSAMPHKKNPILLERITGLARVLRGYAVTALENVALWDERDISHSGAERVILPDACIACDYMLHKLTYVIENMEVREERMARNIDFTRGLVFSQRVMLALTAAGMSREQAYGIVQRHAMRCWEDESPLLDSLKGDGNVTKVIKAKDLAQLFSLDPYLAHVDEVFARVGLAGESARRKAAPRQPQRRAVSRVADANLTRQTQAEEIAARDRDIAGGKPSGAAAAGAESVDSEGKSRRRRSRGGKGRRKGSGGGTDGAAAE